MMRMVATLGGFLNRKHDGFPGPKTRYFNATSIGNSLVPAVLERKARK
jgi:hypothetical protein